ncbi:MAG: aminopeptidase N, partial [Quisquiliibacterium sp.]
LMRTDEKITIRRQDYRAPAWLADEIELEFDLDPDRTLVTAITRFRRNPESPGEFTLDGDSLELLEVAVDGRILRAEEYSCSPRLLRITQVPEQFTLRVV